MTKSPKKNNAKDVEKRNDDLRKKRLEAFYQKKRFLVAELRAKGWPVRKIAEHIKMSVGFVRKWCLRLASQIDDIRRARRDKKEKIKYAPGDGIRKAIMSGSTAPKNPRRKITEKHTEAVLNVRKEKFTKRMGAQKIKAYLNMDISHQSINKIMQKAGLIKPGKKRKQKTFDPFRRGYPNDLWQIDHKIFGPGIYMLSAKDDHSSALLAADVRETFTAEDTVEILDKAGRTFGYPRQILSDHGSQFCSEKFEEWCSKHGIEHIMGRVRKPTTQGKIERWHGTVLAEAELPPKGSSAEEYGKAVLEYMEFYNNRRPHHGIGLQIPIIVYLAGLISPDVFTDIDVHEVP